MAKLPRRIRGNIYLMLQVNLMLTAILIQQLQLINTLVLQVILIRILTLIELQMLLVLVPVLLLLILIVIPMVELMLIPISRTPAVQLGWVSVQGSGLIWVAEAPMLYSKGPCRHVVYA